MDNKGATAPGTTTNEPDSENVTDVVDVEVPDTTGTVVVEVEPLPARQIRLVDRYQPIPA